LILGWGYLLTLASLVLVIPLAIVFIFAPLKLVYAKQHFDKVPLAVLGYFTCIGIGFMSIEIALLERVYLLLDSRTITLATVLSAMLIGSGLGSVALGQRKWTANKILLLVATFSFPLLYLFFWFEQVFEATSLWLWPSRLLFAFCMILAISVPLGVFMPHGLRQLASQQSMLIAWCWGINGFASVFGVLLAPLIALEIGLSGLLLTGLSCYVFAALLFKHYEAKRILP